MSSVFAAQWLQLAKLATHDIKPDISPDVPPDIKTAMSTETQLYFEDQLQNGGALGTLLGADYAFINPALAAPYGELHAAHLTKRLCTRPLETQRHHGARHRRGPIPARYGIISRGLMDQVRYLFSKMNEVVEPDGTLLDNGIGIYNSDGGEGDGHDHKNLPVLVLGSALGKIPTGRNLLAVVVARNPERVRTRCRRRQISTHACRKVLPDVVRHLKVLELQRHIRRSTVRNQINGFAFDIVPSFVRDGARVAERCIVSWTLRIRAWVRIHAATTAGENSRHRRTHDTSVFYIILARLNRQWHRLAHQRGSSSTRVQLHAKTRNARKFSSENLTLDGAHIRHRLAQSCVVQRGAGP